MSARRSCLRKPQAQIPDVFFQGIERIGQRQGLAGSRGDPEALRTQAGLQRGRKGILILPGLRRFQMNGRVAGRICRGQQGHRVFRDGRRAGRRLGSTPGRAGQHAPGAGRKAEQQKNKGYPAHYLSLLTSTFS